MAKLYINQTLNTLTESIGQNRGGLGKTDRGELRKCNLSFLCRD